MSIQDSTRELLEGHRPKFLQVACEEDRIYSVLHEGSADRGIEFRWFRMGSRREIGRRNPRLGSANESPSIRVIADHDRNPGLKLAGATGVNHRLHRGALMRRQDPKSHGHSVVHLPFSSIIPLP
jgi:hypothetical protein